MTDLSSNFPPDVAPPRTAVLVSTSNAVIIATDGKRVFRVRMQIIGDINLKVVVTSAILNISEIREHVWFI